MSPVTIEALWKEMQALNQEGLLYEKAMDYGKQYLRQVYNRDVAAKTESQNDLSIFRESLPETVGDPFQIIDTLHQVGSAGTVAQGGGRFFGLVNGGVIPTALAARIIADTWDQNAVLYSVSPTNAVIEETCQDWLNQLFGLPQQTVAGFVSGTSMAIVCGLAAARWRLYKNIGLDINAEGLCGAPKLRIVAAKHTHSTVFKAIALLGFGTQNIELVNVDVQGRLVPDDLPQLDNKTIVILQAGNVNSGAFDPIRQVCEIANKSGSWVHIDGAFGLWAAASAPLSHLTDGIDLANSWSVDGHKTLNTPYDNGISLCADPEAMIQALQNSADYIMYSDKRDGMLFTPEMSRRARAIDLWATIKYLGRIGIDRMINGFHERAQQFAKELKSAGFVVVNDVVFNQVMIQIGNQVETDNFVTAVQNSGKAWVGGSSWFGQPVVRISVCSWATTSKDVTASVETFVAALK